VETGECVQPNDLPGHVAIIMDGNGRWAKRRGLSRESGHLQGSIAAENIIRYAHELGIKYITLYAFSSENWQRPQREVDAVMRILESYLTKDPNQLIDNGIKILAIGDLERLPTFLKSALSQVIERTQDCSKLVITLALAYGSWGEIICACKSIAKKVNSGEIGIDQIDESLIKKALYSKEIPDPDLFIRTSGELRLSNFLLLQLSYSELYFTKTLWPDFQIGDFDKALLSYKNRRRRFGKTELE